MVHTVSLQKDWAANELYNSINANMEQQQQGISSKSKHRFLLSRNENFEKQLAELLQALSTYGRRIAKLRDAGDTVTEVVNAISLAEMLNPSLKQSTFELAKSLRNIQDHRDSEVLYIEEKLLPYISQLGASVKKQREETRSAINKVFNNRKKNIGSSSWMNRGASSSSLQSSSSSSSRRRRSQSVERSSTVTTDRVGKEEKMLRQTIQQNELRKNFIFKKLLLKFILSELRLTIRSLNDMTAIYQNLMHLFVPSEDMKVFNEFFSFRSLKRSVMVDIETLVNDDIDSAEDDELFDSDQEDDSSEEESGLEQDSDENSAKEKEEEKDFHEKNQDIKQDVSTRNESIVFQSTLRRFNSTPEIATTTGEKDQSKNPANQSTNSNIIKLKDSSLPKSVKMIHNKLTGNSKKTVQQLKGNDVDYKSSDDLTDDSEDDEDDDDEDDDDEEYQEKVKNKRNKPTVGAII